MLSLLSNGIAFAGDVLPTKPSELGEWFSSGAATLVIIVFAAKFLWDWAQKAKDRQDSKKEDESKQFSEAIRSLQTNFLDLKSKHEGLRINELITDNKQVTAKLSTDLEKFTEKLGDMAMKWATEMAKKEAVITHIKDDVVELKTKLNSVPLDEIQIKLSKLNDKIEAAFQIISGKRDPR